MIAHRLVSLIAISTLTACGGGGTSTSGPGEVTFAGLTYDVLNGGNFVGLAPATNVPTGGIASYAGVVRGNILGDYRDGRINATADFGAATLNVSGQIDFTDVSTGDGIVSFNETTTISGTQFSSSSTTSGTQTTISGSFYNTDASVIGGTVFTTAASGSSMLGAFIGSSTPYELYKLLSHQTLL